MEKQLPLISYFFIYGIVANIFFIFTATPLKAEECLANVVDSDLMLLHPGCSEEQLYEAGIGAVTDPFVSFDSKNIFFSYFPDTGNITSLDSNSKKVPAKGSNIYSVNLKTKQVTQLSHQKFTPNTGAGLWNCTGADKLFECSPMGSISSPTHSLGNGIFNPDVTPLPVGKIIFTSNHNDFNPETTLSEVFP